MSLHQKVVNMVKQVYNIQLKLICLWWGFKFVCLGNKGYGWDKSKSSDKYDKSKSSDKKSKSSEKGSGWDKSKSRGKGSGWDKSKSGSRRDSNWDKSGSAEKYRGDYGYGGNKGYDRYDNDRYDYKHYNRGWGRYDEGIRT